LLRSKLLEPDKKSRRFFASQQSIKWKIRPLPACFPIFVRRRRTFVATYVTTSFGPFAPRSFAPPAVPDEPPRRPFHAPRRKQGYMERQIRIYRSFQTCLHRLEGLMIDDSTIQRLK
jgi:hypothetical protein